MVMETTIVSAPMNELFRGDNSLVRSRFLEKSGKVSANMYNQRPHDMEDSLLLW